MRTKKLSSNAPRQLSEEKEQLLLNAAKDIFFTKGIRAASMDEIARLAGVSKTTIYRRYQSKNQMFKALMINSIEDLSKHFETLEFDEQQPVESLMRAAQIIRKTADHAEFTNVLRQLIAEAPHDPELTQEACEFMMNSVPRGLITFFKKLIAAGHMQHDYPDQAAATFFLICTRGVRPLLNALGKQKDEKKRLVADLDMFMRGCQIRNPH